MVSCTAAHTSILFQPPGQNGDLTKNMGKMKLTSPGTKKKTPLRAKSVKKMTDDEIMTALSTYLTFWHFHHHHWAVVVSCGWAKAVPDRITLVFVQVVSPLPGWSPMSF